MKCPIGLSASIIRLCVVLPFVIGSPPSAAAENIPEDRTQVLAPPRPISTEEWVKASDFSRPRSDFLYGGKMAFRLTVDPDGHVVDCDFPDGSKPERVAQETCAALMARATFRAAVTSSGEPTFGPLDIRMYFGFGEGSYSRGGNPNARGMEFSGPTSPAVSFWAWNYCDRDDKKRPTFDLVVERSKLTPAKYHCPLRIVLGIDAAGQLTDCAADTEWKDEVTLTEDACVAAAKQTWPVIADSNGMPRPSVQGISVRFKKP